MATATVSLARGLANSAIPDVHLANSRFGIAWSNVDFTQATIDGNEPITFLLKCLMSTKAGGNGSYDDISAVGSGLGIPQDMVDIASFTAIQQQDDYDVNQRVFLIIPEPQPAKKFIEDELCRPFGYYLLTGNDGRLKLLRPKHPQKFHVSKANNEIRVKVPSGGSQVTAALAAGIYTGQQMATEIARALNLIIAPPWNVFTCVYDTSGGNHHKFTLSNPSYNFDMVASPAGDNGWLALGFTSFPSNQPSVTADATRGEFSGLTLGKNDLWDVRVLENRDDQITSVIYHYNYDPTTQEYKRQTAPYIDAEAINLGDILGARNLVIKSKGLISTDDYTACSFTYFKAPSSGCDPVQVKPDSKYGIQDDSWATTFASMLLDRYKQPPLKFKAKLKWEWNLLEVGDVLKLDYDIAGVFADYELDKSTVAGRLFEIVQLNPNFRDGFLEATFLGHRYVSY